jgi:hypothetical protein
LSTYSVAGGLARWFDPAEIGHALGVTAESVRATLEQHLPRDASLTVACSSTFRILEQLRALAPRRAAECELAVAPLLGGRIPIQAVLDFVRGVQRQEPDVVIRRGMLEIDARVSHAPASWHRSAWKCARELTKYYGGAQLEAVAGRMMLDAGVRVERDHFVAVLLAEPDFLWLDEEHGWFTFRDLGAMRGTGLRVAKILAVAKRPIGADEIAARLAAVGQSIERYDPIGAPLPLRALIELLKAWPWVRRHHGDHFRAAADLTDALTSTDRAIVECISTHGGVAAKHVMLNHVKQCCGVAGISLAGAARRHRT